MIDAHHALAVLRALELGSDWFVLLLAVAALSRHHRYVFMLAPGPHHPVSACDWARSAAILLLTARAVMCGFAIGQTRQVAEYIDVGRVVANFLTSVAVVPLFVSFRYKNHVVETEEVSGEQPESMVKLFRLVLVLYASTLAVSYVAYRFFE